MKFRNVSVARKIIVYFILSSFAIAMIGTTVSLIRDFNLYKIAIKERFNEIESSHIPSLATSLYVEDLPQIKNNLDGILSVQDMSYLEVTLDDDPEDEIAFKRGEKNKGNVLNHKIRVVYINPNQPDDPPEPLGYILIQANLSGVTNKIKNQIIIFVIIQLFQFILVSFIMYSIFKNLISKHLERMSNYAESIDLVDLSGPELKLERASVMEKDELDNVVLSLNKMKEKLKSSHEQLKDYSLNLENKVREATEEIESEKNKVDDLLNNMKQAIFVVNEDLVVIPPVSHFATNVFDENIVGKSIFDSLFKDFDKNSETIANLESALTLVYGDDYIQFELVEEHLLRKINYYSKIAGVKTLSISYTPLFNEEELLEHLMFVVDDITEKEKLEAEVLSEKETNQKNISIITEMAKVDIEDLEIFLDNAKGILQKSMILAKSKPNKEEVIHELFRFLHTLKGSARAFNFDSISSITHLVESSVSEKLEVIKSGGTLRNKHFEPIIDNLYLLSQEVLEYGNLAKKVFKIENEFGKKIINDIQNYIVDIENFVKKEVTTQEHFLGKTGAFKKRMLIYKKIQNRNMDSNVLENLRRSTHSLKSSLRANSGLMHLGESVHTFEKSFDLFNRMENTTLDDFTDSFVESYFFLKDSLRSNFIQSHLGSFYTTYKEDWAQVFLNFFKFTMAFDKNEMTVTSKGNFILDVIIGRCEKLGLNLILKEARDLKLLLLKDEKDESEKELITSIMSDLWNYLLLVCKMDFYQLEKGSEQEIQNKTLEKISSRGRESDHDFCRGLLQEFEIKTIILLTLKNVLDDGYLVNDFFEAFGDWTGHKKLDSYVDILGVSSEDSNPDLKGIRSLLKTSHVNRLIVEKISNDVNDHDPVASILKKFFEEDSYYTYLKFIDFHQLLSSYLATGREEVRLRKVEMCSVVMRNITKLEGLTERSGSLDEIKKAVRRLKDTSVIPLLGKFKTMVLDLGEKLNKSVLYEVKGSEISMNKDSFHILQDAFVHVLRNSIDHGIETPEERVKSGKSSKGRIEVICFDESDDDLKIIIKDDGRGIDLEKIAKKAADLGLVKTSQLEQMSREEIFNIIFMPTFSQRESVDELSGRGVGMDIVKKNLNRLGGDVSVKSEKGRGTEITLTFKPGAPGA